MIDNELQSTENFVLYTTANEEVKLKVVSILDITGFKLFPFWKQFKKKFNNDVI
jgi:hypothetical protein